MIKAEDLPKVSKSEMAKYQDYAKGLKKVTGITLEDTEMMDAKAVIPEITVFTVGVSKIIEGQWGDYQIAEFKDLKGNTGKINLSGPRVGAMKEGKVYTVKKSVKSGADKGADRFSRLSIKYGLVTEGGNAELKKFEGVKMGETAVSGTVIGITDTKLSCQEHNEANESPICSKCSKPKNKLSSIVYIQTNEDVEQVKINSWNLEQKFEDGADPEVWMTKQLDTKKVKVEADTNYSQQLEARKIVIVKVKEEKKTEEACKKK